MRRNTADATRRRPSGGEVRALVAGLERRVAIASLILGGLAGLVGGTLGGALARWVWGG